jgi:hypothetical protein
MSIQYKRYLRNVTCVERLFCKRPILCLASFKMLTPHPLTPTALYSTIYIYKYFVVTFIYLSARIEINGKVWNYFQMYAEILKGL